ncbi:MAG: NADP-dependent oxidoreductase [Pseudomonadota bacterium]|nr:NADP-dependent oxidoreductase [Pseudomonadota bacterium]
MTANRSWVLLRRPEGVPRLEDFEARESELREPAEGEVLLRVLYTAMDPAIRGFMNAGGGYAAPLVLGAPVKGMVLGRVLRSKSQDLAEGDIAWGFGSWSDYVTVPAAQLHRPPLEAGLDLPAYLHVLGTIGLTAHYGLFDVAAIGPGARVLVSGAAGAVGSLAGQMARIAGASRIVGIAGGAEKCARAVADYGYDACIDYKAELDLTAAIGAALPEGIDVGFENVGGAALDGALAHLRKNARIALCGMISGYNAEAWGLKNAWSLVVNTARLQGFRVTDVLADRARTAAMLAEIASWVAAGKLRWHADVREGFEAIPESFLCLFSGAHSGRLLVQLAAD